MKKYAYFVSLAEWIIISVNLIINYCPSVFVEHVELLSPSLKIWSTHFLCFHACQLCSSFSSLQYKSPIPHVGIHEAGLPVPKEPDVLKIFNVSGGNRHRTTEKSRLCRVTCGYFKWCRNNRQTETTLCSVSGWYDQIILLKCPEEAQKQDLLWEYMWMKSWVDHVLLYCTRFWKATEESWIKKSIFFPYYLGLCRWVQWGAG